MIYQNGKKEKPLHQFSKALKELKIGKLMYKLISQNHVVFPHMR